MRIRELIRVTTAHGPATWRVRCDGVSCAVLLGLQGHCHSRRQQHLHMYACANAHVRLECVRFSLSGSESKQIPGLAHAFVY
jgi:hypothetical protein